MAFKKCMEEMFRAVYSKEEKLTKKSKSLDILWILKQIFGYIMDILWILKQIFGYIMDILWILKQIFGYIMDINPKSVRRLTKEGYVEESGRKITKGGISRHFSFKGKIIHFHIGKEEEKMII